MDGHVANAAEKIPAPSVTILGSFPPQTQGISGYCGALAEALAPRTTVEALGFRAMYPSWLFPGVTQVMDPTVTVPTGERLTVRHALAWYNPVGWLVEALRLRSDVLHIQWWSLALTPVCVVFALVARLRGIPVVVTAHNVRPHEPSRPFRWASRAIYGLARHILVHSDANLRQLQTDYGIAPGRTSHVPMGITKILKALPGRAEACRTLGLPEGRPILLFFGIIRPYKGVAVLLEALDAVRQRRPDVLLVIAGKPWGAWTPYEAIITERALGDHVHCVLDYVPEAEVAHYFAAARLVVLPYTHFDAQSAVGAQALGFAKPLLVTETGGLPELVGHDPRYCVPPQDPAALAQALVALLDSEEADGRVGEKASPSWAESAEGHLEIYRRAVGAD